MAKNNGSEDKKISKLHQAISKLKIGARVQLMALIVICAIAIPMIVSVVLSSNYIRIYNNVLENLESIRYIMNETQNQGQRILGYCVVSKNIEKSGETEIIVNMQNKFDKIRKNISADEDNEERLEKLDTVENLLNNYINSYKEGISLCEDTFSLAGDVKFYSMVNTSEYLSKNCNELLSLELERSGILNNSIISNFQYSIYSIVVAVIIIIILAVLLSLVITSSITIPLKILRNKISIIAKGDLTGQPIHINTKDEIGELSTAFNSMKTNLTNILEKVSEVSGEIEESVVFVTERIEENSARSQELSATMDQVSTRMENQNEETHSAQEKVHTINEVTERIAGNADSIMENTEKSMLDSKSGNDNMERYTKQLEDVNAIMIQVSDVVEQLGSSAEEMNDIIQTITNIADQTNLLSLNASIEAAKAGDSGRGFAVVASEIGNLAENSSTSAQKIADIITEVQSNSKSMTEKMAVGLEQLEAGNKIAQDTMKSFKNIQKGIQLVNSNVKEILNNINELSSYVEDVYVIMNTVRDATDDNTTATNEIGQTVHGETENLIRIQEIMGDLSSRASQLEETVTQFKLN